MSDKMSSDLRNRIKELEEQVRYWKKEAQAQATNTLTAMGQNAKLREAAMAYSNNTGHTAKCRFWMNVQQQVSGSPCICGHAALAELLEAQELGYIQSLRELENKLAELREAVSKMNPNNPFSVIEVQIMVEVEK